jgi:hypothetical protein
MRAQRPFDLDRVHARNKRGGFGGNRVVARHQDGYRTMVSGQGGIQPELTDRLAVAADLADDRAADRVCEDRARGARPAVVADEHAGVDAGLDAGEHAVRLGLSAYQPGSPVQHLRQQVAELRVRIADEHRRVGREGQDSPDGGIGLGGHQVPVAFVLRPTRANVRRIDDPGDALHVDRDENAHGSAPFDT